MKSGCVSQQTKKGRKIPLPVLPNSSAQESGIQASRTSRWRAGALIALNLLMVAHIIQWWLMGETVSPIEPSEAMYTLQRGAVNAGVIFFSLAILATLIFGRFVCGWGCHIVALQDLCGWLLKKIGLKPRPFRSRLLVFVPLIAALYMFVWPTVARYIVKPPDEPLIPQFTNHLITTEFWATFPPVAVAIPFLFICGFVTVYFLGQKGFCTYACPYGGFFSLADKVAPGKIRVTDACNQCGHCTATCTSNVLVHAEVKQYGMVVDPGCMKCMDCVSVCPNEALYFGFGKPSILSEPRTVATGLLSEPGAAATGVFDPQSQISDFKSDGTHSTGPVSAAGKRPVTKNYSLTWPEEAFAAIVFFLSFIAVWDVYQLVPMLMALGVAAITTYLTLRTWKLFRASDLSFYRYNLKANGKMKAAGWVFAVFALAWIGLNAHSGWVRYLEAAGARAFDSVRIPDELALAQANPSQWLSPADRKMIAEGKNHLRTATDIGLFTNSHALPKLAWLEYLSGNADGAVQLLAESAEHQDGQARALSLYYRGAILNRTGRYDEALISLDEAVAERSDLITALEEKGESLWQLGRRDQALQTWSDAVRGNPNLPLANNFLAGAFESMGKSDDAAAYEKQADRTTPSDPYFHWMLGLRLQNIGMNERAEKHFERAIQINPQFRARRGVNLKDLR